MDTVLWLCPSLPTETLKWLSSLPILMQNSFWWWQCSDRYIISLFPHLQTPPHAFSPSIISRTVSVDVKHHVYLLIICWDRDPKRLGRETIYLTLHSLRQNNSSIKMGSYDSRFNVSLIVDGKATRQCPHHNFWRERRAKAESNRGPSAYQLKGPLNTDFDRF